MSALGDTLTRLARTPATALEFANTLLTTDDATLGASERDVVWTHRGVTLWRYRAPAGGRTHAVPLLLVFALINRPAIFDLRPGSSFVEYVLDEGFDVFLLDWGHPEEEDAEMGLDDYVCDELPWAVRETLRASGAEEISLMGWCIGATLCAMYCGLPRGDARSGGAGPASVRNLALLTMPVDARNSRYARWVGDPAFDVDQVAEQWRVIPGPAVDVANKLLKPVTNFWTTYRRLWEGIESGQSRRDAYQSMAKWVADNPNFPGRAWAQWITLMYRNGDLVTGRARLRGERIDLGRIDQNLLVVTAGADHIAPRPGTMPIFDLVTSEDVTHVDRPGGHIGLVAGSAARREIWPELAEWLSERSGY